MARKKPKFEYAIICDDIREEMRKKLSFIGIYGPNILVSKIPFVFPKLCFAISYKDVKGGDSFSIELKNPSDEQLGKTITGSVPKEVKDNIRFYVFAVFSPLNIKQEGEHKLVITCNDNDKWRQKINFVIKMHDKV